MDILEGPDPPNFVAASSLLTSGVNGFMGAADLNADGKKDLAVALCSFP